MEFCLVKTEANSEKALKAFIDIVKKYAANRFIIIIGYNTFHEMRKSKNVSVMTPYNEYLRQYYYFSEGEYNNIGKGEFELVGGAYVLKNFESPITNYSVYPKEPEYIIYLTE